MKKQDKEIILAKLTTLNKSVNDPIINTLIEIVVDLVALTDKQEELGFKKEKNV